MDEDRIGLVLAKTSELRSKIISCIHNTASNVEKDRIDAESKESEADNQEEEAERLLNIKDALESLEGQLSSLQALQQQQWYEKEVALDEIEHSQKKLLKELKEYKGKDLEVIQEAISFASETDDTNDLLLPPYPRRPSHTLVSENSHISTFTSSRKIPQNGIKNLDDVPNNLHKSGNNRGQSGPWNSVKAFIGTAAKTALSMVGVMAILSLAGFEPRFKKQDNQLKVLDLFRLRVNDEGGTSVMCPPGKVPVIENGETRCVVKERVEVPFESVVVATPDVSYGCG